MTNKQVKILVTGAAGFMGSHLVDYLLEKGYKSVYGVDDLSGGYMRNVNKKSRFTKLDLRDREKTARYIKKIKPELIFHLAADATEGRSQFTPINCTLRNYNAFLNLLVPAIQTKKLKKFVFTSSMSVYGAQKPPFSELMPTSPEDIYAISKAAVEVALKILAEVHQFKWTIVRPHNVYGPKQNLADPYRNVIGIFINSILRGKNFYIYGDGTQIRAFTYIDDFTPYLAKCSFAKKTDGEIFNLGPRKEYTINQMAEIVLNTFFPDGKIPKHLKPKHLPSRPKEVKEAFCSQAKAEKILGYKARVDLEEGIKRMIEWASHLGPQKPVYLDELELISPKTPKTWTKKLI